ncbi:PilZ domain-containing protein [Clostridiaceae bacterium M8S5]|nr:PilZ domain-containing protein [Clostridiaceae bacterium M8S5]
MLYNDFEIGQNITLVKEYKDTDEYISQIVDIIDEVTYKILIPMRKSKTIPLYEGNLITVRYYVPEKGRFSFKAVVLKKLENDFEVIIENLGEERRLQERNHYRLQVELEMRKEYRENENEVKIEIVKTKDISGNGAKILSNYKHILGDEIYCELNIESLLIKSKAKVIRVDDLTENNKYQYAIGLEFIDISKNARDQIVKFIFKRQREMRKKGMI